MANVQLHSAQQTRLFPPIEPHTRFHLDVGSGHEIHVEVSGLETGPSVLVVHGGPGAGSSPYMRRFFDPARYRIVMFDQRGAGRSRPQGALHDNTTWHLLADMEAIRLKLGIDAWHLFGGSWGSTLALLYAQAHPERVRSLVLRGVFTMTPDELGWFYGGGAGRFFPEAWAEFLRPIPPAERDSLIAAYYRRLTSPDPTRQLAAARPWVRWESATASLRPVAGGLLDAASTRAFARIECHYFMHDGWMDEERAILANMDRLAAVPGVVVQGRYDMICPPSTAATLAAHWPSATLRMVDDAGHALSEPGIIAELVRATERFAEPRA